jgi:hypothetical protein
MLRSEDGVDGRQAFSCRLVGVTLVRVALQEALDDAVILHRRLRPVIAVDEPEVLQPLTLTVRRYHRPRLGTLPSHHSEVYTDLTAACRHRSQSLRQGNMLGDQKHNGLWSDADAGDFEMGVTFGDG